MLRPDKKSAGDLGHVESARAIYDSSITNCLPATISKAIEARLRRHNFSTDNHAKNCFLLGSQARY